MTASISGIQPLGNRVLVKYLPAEQTSKGGIIIPDTAKDKSQQAEVITVGPGWTDEAGKEHKVEVKPGDRVLVAMYGGDDVKHDGEEYKIVRGDDLLAVIQQ